MYLVVMKNISVKAKVAGFGWSEFVAIDSWARGQSLGWLHVKDRAIWSSFGFENLPYGHYLITVGHGMPMASSESLRDGLGLFFGEAQCDLHVWRDLISGCRCGMAEAFRSGAAEKDKILLVLHFSSPAD